MKRSQIETHHRVGVGVDGLAADDAEADLLIAEQTKESFEQVGSVHGDGFPEGAALHGWVSRRAMA